MEEPVMQDVLVSLDHCVMSLRQTKRSNGEWKWVVLSLHSAFQYVMLCHLEGTSLSGAIEEKSFKKWIKWYEENEEELEWESGLQSVDEISWPIMGDNNKQNPPPKVMMANPVGLLNRLSGLEMMPEENETVKLISITDGQRKSFKEFNVLRNYFVHFYPGSSYIKIKIYSIKKLMKDVLDIFDVIIGELDPFSNMSHDNKNALCSKIANIRSFL